MTAKSQLLFGNPNCTSWPQLETAEKVTWLKAFLVPLNLTNVSRTKPKVDKFSQLASLHPVALYVDNFCDLNRQALASEGAVKFLVELTSETMPQ